MKLSIIVPVYKVEKYIEKCIVSLLNQDIDEADYEIIIINDGSPDNSGKIIKSFLDRYKNIVIINQENQGVSVARNEGLDRAKGKYILFVDPDDSIKVNTLKSIIENADKFQTDIMYLQITAYNEIGEKIVDYDNFGNRDVILTGIEHPRRTFAATLYAKEAIGDIRFVKKIYRGQDTVFNIMVQSMAQRVTYFDLPYYNYLVRKDSSKQYVKNDRVFNGCILAIQSIIKFQSLHFAIINSDENLYFNNALKLFIERTFQWSILPNLNLKRFIKIKILINRSKLNHILDDLASEYKFINKNFLLFYGFNKLYRLKNCLRENA